MNHPEEFTKTTVNCIIKWVLRERQQLPWEITAGSRRVEFQNDLSAEEYVALMSDNVEDLTELRLWSLEKIKENKAKVARARSR